jgi:hypothetical protein
MSAEQPLPLEISNEQIAEVIPFPRKEQNILLRFGGAIIEATKIVMLGPDYTDKN